MSPKELSYIEDALGHAQDLQKSCTGFANQIQDPELKSYVNSLSTKLGESYNKFYSLLNS
jgi:hypothetical protein